ncbi:MAG: hypothetical protein ACRYF0_16600 [Janthinobacterium lividum]
MTLAQQHRYEMLATKLIFISNLAVITIGNYLTKQGFWAADLSHTTIWVAVLFYPWFFWVAYCIGKGRRWAKITYIVLTVLGLLFTMLDYKRMAPKLFFSTASTSSFFMQQVLYIGICGLILLSLRKTKLETGLAASK